MLVQPSGHLQTLISRRMEMALSWILVVGLVGNFASIRQDLYRPVDMAFSIYYACWLIAMFVLLKLHHVRQTFKLFCWGYWSYACLKALTVAGLHSPIIGSVAPLIMVTAWVHSKRAATVMLLMSVGYYGTLLWLDHYNLLYAHLVRSSEDLFVFYSLTAAAFLGIGLMIVDNTSTLMSATTNMADELTRKVAELQSSQIKLSTLNEELEQRVLQRTADLSQANQALTDTLQRLTITQRQLMDQEKMASLGSMVAGISHELNTPIGNALTTASVMEAKSTQIASRVQDGSIKKSEILNFFSDLNDSSAIQLRSLSRAVDLIQSFKRVAVDQTSEFRRVFQLQQLVRDHVDTFASTLQRAGIEIDIDVPDDITCDSFPGPLGQILGNLIQNTLIHAQLEPGQGRVHISARQEHTKVTVVVADNGAGMPPHVLSRIFDPFFTTRLGQGGSGIGLSISRRIATSILDGDLLAESTPGEGSTFTLTMQSVASGKI